MEANKKVLFIHLKCTYANTKHCMNLLQDQAGKPVPATLELFQPTVMWLGFQILQHPV